MVLMRARSVRLYMKVLERPVTRYYKRASVAYEYDYVCCPTLLYCSKDDTIAIYSTVKRVADRWERDGNYVSKSTFTFVKPVQDKD